MSCVVSCVLASLRGGEVVEYLHTVTEVSIFTEHTNKNRTVLENSLPQLSPPQKSTSHTESAELDSET